MDAMIFPLPLDECRADVENSLIQSGNAKAYPVCGKVFTAARKLGPVCRSTFLGNDGLVFTWSWVLCRKCLRESGGRIPPQLKEQAIREVTLLTAKPGAKHEARCSRVLLMPFTHGAKRPRPFASFVNPLAVCKCWGTPRGG